MEEILKDWNARCWDFESRIVELWDRVDISESEKESIQIELLNRFNSDMRTILPSLAQAWKV